MVESFPGNNKNSNLIEGAKVIENFLNNNENGSSIFQGKIREQDFSAEQKLNELKAAIEELTRQDFLRRTECERQASNCVDEISSQAELHIGEDDDESYFNCEKPLGDFWNFLEPLFNFFEVDVDDPKIYQMLKEKKEKNWLLSIIKFLRDKLKELIKKIFARDLSFDQRLDKEIKELKEKLNSGELSEEEFARALERLEALQNLKLKLQLAVVGWIVTMFAEMFGVELAAAVEASTEKEDKKAEKTSLKEENKEVHKEVEIKVDEREKPKVPVFLFEVSPGFVRPVVLNKPELEIVSDPLKHLLRLTGLERKSHENSQKPEKVNEEKKAKPEPKKEVCPPKPAEQPAEKTNQPKKSKQFKASKRDARRQARDKPPTHNYPIDHFQVPSGTTDKSNASADQRSSASSVQEDPRSKVTDVLNERAARGNGNTPSR
ncbi:SHOCT domain-containing protein [Wolbachia endosymbiont (group A) of Bombylius major]|uniref:SHOCT domain-containing protein n=1 Tax=Wolbachia endosymbiont (group A) of Bombylius major TaxID=2953988 RepID=UPI002231F259|nr:SHOCT domain-containing protein [Wolbachia endosymbiont (group A) of Bombylius major]